MLFSCKITNSAINYLNRVGADLEDLYSSTDLPEEFLRDPSYWLEADAMESFLRSASTVYKRIDPQLPTDEFSRHLGHQCKSLESWGVLDSVLRMMQNSSDVYSQPDRFIGYFISPAPPIGSLIKANKEIAFDIPVSSEEYPEVTNYLKAAVEAIPNYIGEPMGGVDWEQNRIQISWAENDQESFFGQDSDPGHMIKPELAKTLVDSLENSQKALEQKNQELLEKNRELEVAKSNLELKIEKQNQEASSTGHQTSSVLNLAQLADTVAKEIEHPVKYLQEQVMRLSDYLGRSQQLVTLLNSSSKGSRQTKEAMRRMDWDRVQEEYPLVVRNTTEALGRLKSMMVDLSLLVEPTQVNELEKVSVDLNDLLLKVISLVPLPSLVNLNTQLLLDKKIKMHPLRMEQALLNLVSYAVHSLGTQGTLKIRSMRMDTTAILEVFFSSKQRSEQDLLDDFTPFQDGNMRPGVGLGLPIAKSIIERHGGELTVLTNPDGTKFVVQFSV
ncbi:MAG: ATP-binding protein [Bdellovibrionales bacterium]